MHQLEQNFPVPMGATSIFGLMACAAMWTIATPAAAQYGSPPPPPPPQDYPSSQSAPQRATAPAPLAEVMRAAACLAGRDAEAAERLLATAPYSSQERDEATRALRLARRCLRVREDMPTSALALRGAVAESLFEARFTQLPAMRTPAVGVAPWFRADAATTTDAAATLGPVYALADCSAARQPDLIRALLATEPGTAAETAAIQALNPIWNTCVTPGTQLALNRSSIRAILGEALYRWSMVQRDGAGSPHAAAPAPAPGN